MLSVGLPRFPLEMAPCFPLGGHTNGSIGGKRPGRFWVCYLLPRKYEHEEGVPQTFPE